MDWNRVNIKEDKIIHNKTVKEWRMEQKLRLASIITSRLHLGPEDKKAIAFMIKTIPNFKYLSRTCSNETIICALCFYTMKTRKGNVQIEQYSVLKEYGLTEKIYATVITRLCNFYQSKVLTYYTDI